MPTRIVDETAHKLGCEMVKFTCESDRSYPEYRHQNSRESKGGIAALSGPSAIFRLSSGQGRWLTVSLFLSSDSSPAADIVFRYLQRLSIALADRLDWLRPGVLENPTKSVAGEPLPFPAPGGHA